MPDLRPVTVPRLPDISTACKSQEPDGKACASWRLRSPPSCLPRDRELGTFAGDGDTARFEGVAIPTDHWLLVAFTYEVDHAAGPVQIAETLHLRDLGAVPAQFDRSDPMCT